MQSNITEQEYLGGDLQLAEPHFAEEATVLSARPVVPLQNIRKARTRTRSTRHLVFGVSILASLMLGALGATLIYRQRGQEAPAVVVNEVIPGSGAITNDSAVAEAATGEAKGVVAKGNTFATSTPAENKMPKAQVARSVQRSEVARRVQSVTPIKRKEEPRDLVDERETWRADRVEARRLRRRSDREEQDGARGHRRRDSDDLLKIQEIFEGPRRP